MPKVMDTSKHGLSGFGYYLGIDPGASGAIIGISSEGWFGGKMPPTVADISEMVEELRYAKFAVIERLWGYAGDRNTGPTMFKMGRNYGNLEMALAHSDIPYEEVTPRAWQKALGITARKKTESKGEFKNRLKAKAQQLFPQVKMTLAICDAFLIAEYCRRTYA